MVVKFGSAKEIFLLKWLDTWQAIREMRDELTNNSLKIKIIDNKVKAL
ncbi:hypothetical protein [Dehalobacter sp. TBBPA1]